jgi:hypothetical protein
MQGISLLHICSVVAEFERANEMVDDKTDWEWDEEASFGGMPKWMGMEIVLLE